jgi:hypothetical protein
MRRRMEELEAEIRLDEHRYRALLEIEGDSTKGSSPRVRCGRPEGPSRWGNARARRKDSS